MPDVSQTIRLMAILWRFGDCPINSIGCLYSPAARQCAGRANRGFDWHSGRTHDSESHEQ
jgi:hypothetical protein